jgi:hypothetical protein
MPKLKLPPQGGEKWLCIFTFLFMMFRYLHLEGADSVIV